MGFGDPHNAVDGVQGAGASSGGADVYRFGYTVGNDYLTLGWSHGLLVDGPGNDLAVFSNPWELQGGTGAFMHQLIVQVSLDMQTWVEFPHRYVAPDPTQYSRDPADWQGFAGLTPVLLNDQSNLVDPFDLALAGGDQFDLASLPNAGGGAEIKTQGARYVRLLAAPAEDDPHTGAPYLHDPLAVGPTVDGMYGRYVVSR